MTPVDVPSRTLTLIAGEDGNFKAHYSVHNPWTNALKEQVLANKLPCTCAADDQRIAYCHRGASEGELYSLFSSCFKLYNQIYLVSNPTVVDGIVHAICAALKTSPDRYPHDIRVTA